MSGVGAEWLKQQPAFARVLAQASSRPQPAAAAPAAPAAQQDAPPPSSSRALISDYALATQPSTVAPGGLKQTLGA